MNKSKFTRAMLWTLFFQILILLIGIIPLKMNDTSKLELIMTINCGLIGGTVGNLFVLRKEKRKNATNSITLRD